MAFQAQEMRQCCWCKRVADVAWSFFVSHFRQVPRDTTRLALSFQAAQNW